MNQPGTAKAPDSDQREAIEESERKASERQPGSFKDEAIEEKVVEVGGDVTDEPIKGLDPKGGDKPA